MTGTTAAVRYPIDWTAWLITRREQVVGAALACIDASGDLTPEHLRHLGGPKVTAAVERLTAAHHDGTVEEIESAARDLSVAVQCDLPQALATGDTTLTAMLGAVLLTRCRLRQLDEAACTVDNTRLTSGGQQMREVVRGAFVQILHLRGGLTVNLQVPALPPPQHQLPPPQPVTRPQVQAAMRQIDNLISEHRDHHPNLPLIIVITGPPGSGKRTAALDVLHRLQTPSELYADLSHDLTTPIAPGAVLRDWIEALGVPADQIPNDTPVRAAYWRSLTQNGPAVLITGAISAAQVRPLLPGGPSIVIITSRIALSGLMLNGARIVALDQEEGQP